MYAGHGGIYEVDVGIRVVRNAPTPVASWFPQPSDLPGDWQGMSPRLLNLAERGGSGAQHTALATVVTIADARA